MTLNNPKGKNERGRTITYEVLDEKGKHLFDFEGKRYNPIGIMKECRKRKITGAVYVRWTRQNLWGVDTQSNKLTIEETKEK